MNDAEKLAGLIGLARRAGRLACGEEQTLSGARSGKARLVLAAEDAAPGSAKKARTAAEAGGVPFSVIPLDKFSLGAAAGKGTLAVCAVCDRNLAAEIRKRLGGGDDA